MNQTTHPYTKEYRHIKLLKMSSRLTAVNYGDTFFGNEEIRASEELDSVMKGKLETAGEGVCGYVVSLADDMNGAANDDRIEITVDYSGPIRPQLWKMEEEDESDIEKEIEPDDIREAALELANRSHELTEVKEDQDIIGAVLKLIKLLNDRGSAKDIMYRGTVKVLCDSLIDTLEKQDKIQKKGSV